MLGLTNPLSPSPSGLPARCGASPGTVLPFTEAPSQHRALQVRLVLSSYMTRVRTLLTLPLEGISLPLSCVVSPSTGDCWYHIPSPSKQKLKQVSVGRTSVYTVDENGKAVLAFTLVVKSFLSGRLMMYRKPFFSGNLWYRHGVTPSYPQGSSWEHISNNVRKVSVGPLDQVSTERFSTVTGLLIKLVLVP